MRQTPSMITEKLYSPGEAFQIAGSFFYEICDRYYKNFKNLKNTKVVFFPTLLFSELTEKQFEDPDLLASDMNWGLDWNKEWQESIIRLEFCHDSSDIEKLLLKSSQILDIAYDMLEYKMGFWQCFDFTPVLILIKKIKENDGNFLEVKELWNSLLNCQAINSFDEKFAYYSYTEDLIEKDFAQKKLDIYLPIEQKHTIEKSINEFMAKIKKSYVND